MSSSSPLLVICHGIKSQMPSAAAPLLFFSFHSQRSTALAISKQIHATMDRLARMLTQYEMALEMFEQQGVVVLPVSIGYKSPGQSYCGQVNLSDNDQMCKYWPVDTVSKDLRVNSMVNSALAGLRRDFNVAQNLANKHYKTRHYKTRVPSILQSFDGKATTAGRTIKQTLTAYSSTLNFRPLFFRGKDAVRDACTNIFQLVSKHVQVLGPSQRRAHSEKRGRGGESVDERSKLQKKIPDEEDHSGRSYMPHVGIAAAGGSGETSSQKRTGDGRLAGVSNISSASEGPSSKIQKLESTSVCV